MRSRGEPTNCSAGQPASDGEQAWLHAAARRRFQRPSTQVKIEVIDATGGGDAEARVVDLGDGATVGDAIDAAGFLNQPAAISIFGELVSRQRLLQPDDRVELLRDLIVDPMEARRRRAKSAK